MNKIKWLDLFTPDFSEGRILAEGRWHNYWIRKKIIDFIIK